MKDKSLIPVPKSGPSQPFVPPLRGAVLVDALTEIEVEETNKTRAEANKRRVEAKDAFIAAAKAHLPKPSLARGDGPTVNFITGYGGKPNLVEVSYTVEIGDLHPRLGKAAMEYGEAGAGEYPRGVVTDEERKQIRARIQKKLDDEQRRRLLSAPGVKPALKVLARQLCEAQIEV